MIEEQEVRWRTRRRTPAEIQQIVSEFKSGELTQKEFCRRQGLTLSTLGRYLSRVRAASEASNRGLTRFHVFLQSMSTRSISGRS
jgi:hypothetical protein